MGTISNGIFSGLEPCVSFTKSKKERKKMGLTYNENGDYYMTPGEAQIRVLDGAGNYLGTTTRSNGCQIEERAKGQYELVIRVINGACRSTKRIVSYGTREPLEKLIDKFRECLNEGKDFVFALEE